MSIEYEALKNIFCNFHWIDNIPEDQEARDKICLEFNFFNSHIILHNLFPDIAENYLF